ncbi:hypothetical protein HYG86_11165 [Alkalicella caledoniensis]|uniref:Uncharacterized protein n=1 Tax=Alkalicella caledoniensis TaxID=2731377 RepID=A0A7G9W9C0_ALKCA|nr:hypothetical protein [Alkalicella caledoniensis]QNO15282.1 hypothetical protein HYG86_11165 [Alkalicella caledoniensis]
MAFFMPYFSIHSSFNNEIRDVLMAYSPSEVSIKEILVEDSDLRVIHFEDLRDITGTIFSTSLLSNRINGEEDVMFFSSFDYMLNNNVNDGNTIERFGINGIYSGYFPLDHPYGENFLVMVSNSVEELHIRGEIREWSMKEEYQTNFFPRGFRGSKLWSFLFFTGSIYLVFGVCGLLIDTPASYLKDNFMRMGIVSMSILLSILIYGVFYNSYDYYTIIWSTIIAISANLLMILPLTMLWFGKKIYKRV